MKLYHGSDHIVEAPTFGLGKPYNDYGLGFYCTQHPDMAGEWAVGFDHDGFVNEYDFDTNGLEIVDLDALEFTTLHWLAVLLANRWFDVRAPIANDAREYLLAPGRAGKASRREKRARVFTPAIPRRPRGATLGLATATGAPRPRSERTILRSRAQRSKKGRLVHHSNHRRGNGATR